MPKECLYSGNTLHLRKIMPHPNKLHYFRHNLQSKCHSQQETFSLNCKRKLPLQCSDMQRLRTIIKNRSQYRKRHLILGNSTTKPQLVQSLLFSQQ